MIHPPSLRPGDTVAVISPAGPVIPDLLLQGVQTLESWGLKVRLHEATFARHEPGGYLAGSDAARLKALREVFWDPDVAAVICSRGGYGAMRLLPDLLKATHEHPSGAAEFADFLRAHPKLLVGFSDITALHLYIAGIVGVATLHGPVVKSFGLHTDDPFASLEHLRAALFGQREDTGQLRFDGLRCIRAGEARAPVFGGNLTLVSSLVGSPYCPDLNDRILFLEDVGEQDYRLDRLFTTLRLAEKSARPAGIILGDFSGCGGVYIDDGRIDDFVGSLAAEFRCPVVADFPTGHRSRNVCVPVGCVATLDAAGGTVVFEADAAAPHQPAPIA